VDEACTDYGRRIVNGQPAPALPPLVSSLSLQRSLSILDLSSAPLASLPADLSPLAGLTELHVPSAGLAGTFPSALPAGLVVLNAANNSALGGTLPPPLCTNTALKTCDLAGTALSGSCGPCTFS
jgi:hypothetical protein